MGRGRGGFMNDTLILKHNKNEIKSLDLSFKQRLENFELEKISNLASKCDARLLIVLANAFDCNIDYLSEEEARKLISKALILDRYNGTAFAIKEALCAVFPTALVKEWFEYEGKPYFFKVKVSTTDTSFDKRTLDVLDRLILEYKNVRSVLEAVELEVLSYEKDFNAAVSMCGEFIEVLPFRANELENSSKKTGNGAGTFVCEISNTNINFKGVKWW